MAKRAKRTNLTTAICQDLAELGRSHRSEFNGDTLRKYITDRKEFLTKQLPRLASYASQVKSISIQYLNAVYGLYRPDHAFGAICLDWGRHLTEPQATKTLAYLLNKGPDDVKAKRLIAFYEAMQSRNVPTFEQAKTATVDAEVDRIDLMLKYLNSEGDQEGRYSALVIEAKFKHKITKGQLSKYYNKVKKDKSVANEKIEPVVLGFDEDVMGNLKGRQKNLWTFVSWRDMWLRFEKLRPIENDPNLTIFLRWLWCRINQKF